MGFQGLGGNIQHNTKQVANCLPRPLSDLPIIVVLKTNLILPDGFNQLCMKQSNIINWIFSLQIPYTSYCDIVIDHDEMKSLPETHAESYISHFLLISFLTK